MCSMKHVRHAGFLSLLLSFVAAARVQRRQNGPVPPDTIKDCTYFYDSQPGDTCASISNDWGITQEQFITYNPSVKFDCSGIVTGNAYCVEENFGNGPAPPATTTPPPTTTILETSQTSSSTEAAGPSPTQTGIITSCEKHHDFDLPEIRPLTLISGTKYYQAIAGDSCAAIVDKFGTFSLTDFETWNPAVGQSCSTLFADYYYCVAIPGTPTARPSTTAPPSPTGPSPTQSGIVSSCSQYYKAISGDTCAVIADKFGTFGVGLFISWNPALKPDCSLLFLDYYYCIAVPGTPTTRPSTSTSTSTSKAPTGPTPTQSGIISSCTKYYQAVSGDSCAVIEAKYGTFTVAQFQTWNPAVKPDCSQLYLGYYYCIAIPGTPTSRTSSSTSEPPTPMPTPNGPQPQQPGIVSNCNKYYKVVGGDTCDVIGNKQNPKVTTTNFLKWNTGIKSDCSNLFLGYNVCVGVA